jgi:hypothetical protein
MILPNRILFILSILSFHYDGLMLIGAADYDACLMLTF